MCMCICLCVCVHLLFMNVGTYGGKEYKKYKDFLRGGKNICRKRVTLDTEMGLKA